jgi:pimeloyl-ACP methyl ester carboxylesterase
MATFMLIHGMYAGGWCWKHVTSLLRAAGHDVYTPTLTGTGERVHLAGPAVDLDTHITDVVNVLAFEELQDVILAGWSYGGVVITGVADRAPARLRHLVYLDADLPKHGQSDLDLEVAEVRTRREAQARAAGDGWQVPRPDPERMDRSLRDWIPDDETRRWFFAKLTDHPFKTLAQPLHLSNPAALDALGRTYILCTEGKSEGDIPLRTVAWLRHEPGWRIRELASTHFAPISAPREVADLLLELAALP